MVQPAADRLPILETSRGLAAALAIGLALGVISQLGQSLLPEGVGQLANSISPWLSVAFVVGAVQSTTRNAMLAGFVTLLAALIGYYAIVFLRFGYTGGGSSLVLWSIGSVAGGLVFGPAGWFWRNGTTRARTIAVALLGSAWVAEGAYLALMLSMTGAAVGYVLIGLGVPLVLRRSLRDRLLAWAAMLPAVCLGGLGFVALLTVSDVLGGM